MAELLGTLAFGWCITHHGSLVVLPVITLAALLALPLEVWCIQRVCQTAYAEVHKLASQMQTACLQTLPACSIVVDLSTCGLSVARQCGGALQNQMCLDFKPTQGPRIRFAFAVNWHEHAVFTLQVVDCAAEALIKDRAEAIAERAAQHDGAVLPQGGNILKDMLRGMHASFGWPPYHT